MPKTYLSFTHTFWVALITVLLWSMISFGYFILWILFLAGLIYLWRKKGSLYKENFETPNTTYLSPITGEVKGILLGVDHPFFGKDLVQIQLELPLLAEIGLYFPSDGEVLERYTSKGKPFSRMLLDWTKKKRLRLISKLDYFRAELIKFRLSNGVSMGMQIMQGFCLDWPRLWIAPGDKGKAGACFGHLPYGGHIFLYFPKGTEILVKKNNAVVSGQTVIAGEA